MDAVVEREVIISYKPVKTPLIYQIESTECGAASLAIIMRYYGVHIPMEQLRIDTGVSRDGCKASKVLQGARKYHFETSGKKMGLNAIFHTKPPCIIHWNFNHFLVYEGTKGNYVYLNDPAQGKRKLTMEEFDQGFTGVVLQVNPTKEVEKTKNADTLSKYLVSKMRNYYKDVSYLFLLGLILVIPGIIIPILSKYFIDEILISKHTSRVSDILLAMILVILFQAFLTFYRNYMITRLQMKMSLISAYNLVHHMIKLPINFFYQRSSGDLAGRIENNNHINEFIAGEMATSILNLITAFFYLVVLFLYNMWLTLFGLITVALSLVLLKVISKNFSKTILKVQQDQGKLIGVIYTGINIIQTLKAAGIENQYVSRILGYYTKYMEGKQKNNRTQQILNALPAITKQICDVIILIAGGCFVIRGDLTIGGLVAFCTLLNSFVSPVNELTGFVERIQTVKADRDRVEDIIQYGSRDAANEEVAMVDFHKKLSGKVVMKQVAFGYCLLDPPLIEDFNFVLEPGKSVAFVGSSGSGKSTISKILSGLYTQWNGEVLYDDMQLLVIPKEAVTSSIATVSQDISIFSGSIRENLTLWNDTIREEDIIHAAKDAVIHEVITQKPLAYDFHLEEGGRNISGGQRQRLEIARALVMNPSILIMDEATSALDPLTEKEIIDNIKRRGCSCIIIAHRLSAIRDCDEIIVLDQGKIVQRGTHEELTISDGLYKNLFVKK